MELFLQVAAGFRGEVRILSNIKDGAFCKHSQEPFTIFVKTSFLDVWQGSEYASELASKVTDVSFLNQFEYQS